LEAKRTKAQKRSKVGNWRKELRRGRSGRDWERPRSGVLGEAKGSAPSAGISGM
jgi:hypothetical protein